MSDWDTADYWVATWCPDGQPALTLALCADRVMAQYACAYDHGESVTWIRESDRMLSAPVAGGTYRVTAAADASVADWREVIRTGHVIAEPQSDAAGPTEAAEGKEGGA